jgi:triacylglycerol lipase
MAKFNRRQLLLGGVAAGTVATLGTEYVRREQAVAQQATLEALAAEYYDADAVLQVALTGDTRMVKEFQEIQSSAAFPPPAVPYDRQISKRLILCSRLATQQYLTGRNDPKYDGNICALFRNTMPASMPMS